MIRLINKSERALGLPCVQFPSVILEKQGGEKVITNEHFEEVSKNSTVAQWISKGLVLVQKLADPKGMIEKPEGMSVTILELEDKPLDDENDDYRPAQVRCESVSRGWWHVFVNDHRVTDKAVRKAEAEKIAREYD